jgi:hypothetical protein
LVRVVSVRSRCWAWDTFFAAAVSKWRTAALLPDERDAAPCAQCDAYRCRSHNYYFLFLYAKGWPVNPVKVHIHISAGFAALQYP